MMNQSNPYQSPVNNLDPETKPVNGEILEKAASGQRMLMMGILLNMMGMALSNFHPLLSLILIGAAIVSIVGITRMAGGLGHGSVMVVFMAVSMFFPCINLIVLLVLNGQATKVLRQAGYKVGLMGARKK